MSQFRLFKVSRVSGSVSCVFLCHNWCDIAVKKSFCHFEAVTYFSFLRKPSQLLLLLVLLLLVLLLLTLSLPPEKAATAFVVPEKRETGLPPHPPSPLKKLKWNHPSQGAGVKVGEVVVWDINQLGGWRGALPLWGGSGRVGGRCTRL